VPCAPSGRGRAAQARLPDFARLVSAWGGVSIVTANRFVDSPAYRLNHEEIQKALEEGIRFVESMDPDEAVPDENGWLKEVVFKRMRRESGPLRRHRRTVRFPARTLLVAAGTSPNITLRKGAPRELWSGRPRQFLPPRTARREAPTERFASCTVQGKDGSVSSPPRSTPEGWCRSSRQHPQYAGNVVKAMARPGTSLHEDRRAFAPIWRGFDPRDQPVRRRALRATVGGWKNTHFRRRSRR